MKKTYSKNIILKVLLEERLKVAKWCRTNGFLTLALSYETRARDIIEELKS